MSLLLLFTAPIAGHEGAVTSTVICPPPTFTPGGVTISLDPVVIGVSAPVITFIPPVAPYTPKITIAGVDRTISVRRTTIRVTRVAGSEPRNCSFKINSVNEFGQNFTPTYGMDVKVGLGGVATTNQLI